MKCERGSLEEFIEDIEPFFYGKRITYVDVGAFKGVVYKSLLHSRLKIRESHLFEANPLNFEALKSSLSSLGKGNFNIHNLALSEVEQDLKISLNEDMSKIIVGENSIDLCSVASVRSTTLDSYMGILPQQHISLLKIDVEGFEKKVLAGAQGLLSNQYVDVIYIEAGMDKTNSQQCYYRDIDDIMSKYGYRIFRIYEQMFEWMKDSPLLRRVNIAYMSESFANNNPYRVSLELFALEKRLEESNKIVADLEEKNADIILERDAILGKHEDLLVENANILVKAEDASREKELMCNENAHMLKEMKALVEIANCERAKNQVLQSKIKALRTRFEAMVLENTKLRKMIRKSLMGSVLKICRSPLSAWRLFRRRFLPIVIDALQSPRKIAFLPRALLSEFRNFREGS